MDTDKQPGLFLYCRDFYSTRINSVCDLKSTLKSALAIAVQTLLELVLVFNLYLS